ncbi:uncharacterized protein LOC121837191 [Ixodes scapularis]|uniref:uncharacterized protein LOC121837191 n=1 Tax=Ixodes scapularis TaxID=6945 RepID=UPI001C385310|nr:uncharacterized protein LOC121837191 [Ixodes scapularis]
MPHMTCENVFGDFQSLLEVILNKHAKQIRQAMTISDTLTDSHGVLGTDFPSCLFDKVKSSYQREQFAKRNFLYVEPEEHLLLSPETSSFQYIPIGKVIENLFEVPALAEHLLQPAEQLRTDPHELRSFREGTALKQVPTNNNESVHNLHVALYTDELGITNPLGPNQKRHKLLVVYFSLLDLHPRYRADLSNIHLTLMAKYQDVEKEGLQKVLDPLLRDLAELRDHGFQVQSSKGSTRVKATVAAVCGDNLSLNKLGGFSCCFSSGRVCRFCMAHKATLADLTREDLCTLRNAATHSKHLSAISVNPALKKLYGVNGPSPMLALENFDITKQLMPDIMHDMFEGGFAVVLHYTLQGLTSDGILTLSDFSKVATFKVGFNDKKIGPKNCRLTSPGTTVP